MGNPISMIQLTTKPTVAMTYFENIAKVVNQLGSPFEEYEKRSGINEKGDNKLAARLRKLTPIYTQFERLLTPEEQLKFMERLF